VVPRRVERRHKPCDLFDTHPRPHLLIFGEVADALADGDGPALGGISEDQRGAGRRPEQAHEGSDQGCFAGAVAPQEGERLSGIELQIDTVQHAGVGVAEVQVVDGDGRGR